MKKIFPSVRTKKTTSLSSPQRQIRKNAEEQHRRDRESSDESEVTRADRRDKRKSRPQEVQANSEEGFKEPQSPNDSLEVTYTLTLKKTSLQSPEVTEALETLRRHGCVLTEETRRKSIESCVSTGGSSGYLGGSSSGTTSSSGSSSGRSRLSLLPEPERENHRVRSLLPQPPELALADSVEELEEPGGSEGKDTERLFGDCEKLNEFEEEVRSERSEMSSESGTKTPGAKRGRKRKSEIKLESERKKVKSGEEPELETSRTEDQRYSPESKVFARYCIDH